MPGMDTGMMPPGGMPGMAGRPGGAMPGMNDPSVMGMGMSGMGGMPGMGGAPGGMPF